MTTEQVWSWGRLSDIFLSVLCVCVQLYGGDLESEFSHFQDWLRVFPVYKGRASGEDEEEDEEARLMGKYKVMYTELSVYYSGK